MDSRESSDILAMAWLVVAAEASSGGEECEMEVEGMMQLLWSTGGRKEGRNDELGL